MDNSCAEIKQITYFQNNVELELLQIIFDSHLKEIDCRPIVAFDLSHIHKIVVSYEKSKVIFYTNKKFPKIEGKYLPDALNVDIELFKQQDLKQIIKTFNK